MGTGTNHPLPFKKKIHFIIFGCLYADMHISVRVPMEAKRGVEYPRTGVTGACVNCLLWGLGPEQILCDSSKDS